MFQVLEEHITVGLLHLHWRPRVGYVEYNGWKRQWFPVVGARVCTHRIIACAHCIYIGWQSHQVEEPKNRKIKKWKSAFIFVYYPHAAVYVEWNCLIKRCSNIILSSTVHMYCGLHILSQTLCQDGMLCLCCIFTRWRFTTWPIRFEL